MTSHDPVEAQTLQQQQGQRQQQQQQCGAAAFLTSPHIPAQCGGHVRCGCVTGGEAA